MQQKIFLNQHAFLFYLIMQTQCLSVQNNIPALHSEGTYFMSRPGELTFWLPSRIASVHPFQCWSCLEKLAMIALTSSFLLHFSYLSCDSALHNRRIWKFGIDGHLDVKRKEKIKYQNVVAQYAATVMKGVQDLVSPFKFAFLCSWKQRMSLHKEYALTRFYPFITFKVALLWVFS
jgi:hypothetical protein